MKGDVLFSALVCVCGGALVGVSMVALAMGKSPVVGLIIIMLFGVILCIVTIDDVWKKGAKNPSEKDKEESIKEEARKLFNEYLNQKK